MRTSTAPRRSSHPRRTASSVASAASTRPWRRASSRTCATSRPSPMRKTRRRVSPGASATATCSAAQGSSPAPNRPESALRSSAAGRASDRLRPRNEVRSAVAEDGRSLADAKATRPANSWLKALVARMAPVSASWSVTTWRCWPAAGGPRTHSLYAKTLSRRGASPWLCRVSRDSFTGSAGSTKTSSVWWMPSAARSKRVTPAAWRITKRPLSGVRGSGPGVGDHAAPVSSSRTRMASPVGSLTGSFANGVSRFSRLFSDQVNADPEAVTIVPNRGFAMTLAQGSGVSWSPSRTIAYSRPPSAKPPVPLAKDSGGAAGWVDGRRTGLVRSRVSASSGGGRVWRSSWCASGPRSSSRTARATAARRTRSPSGIRSARSRYAPPGRCFHALHGPLSRSAASCACTSSR